MVGEFLYLFQGASPRLVLHFGFCYLVFLIRLMPGSTELILTEKDFYVSIF